MGYYSDEFFKEYDEIYSDSGRRGSSGGPGSGGNNTNYSRRSYDGDGSQRTVRRPSQGSGRTVRRPAQNTGAGRRPSSSGGRPVSRDRYGYPNENYDRNAYDRDIYGVGRYNTDLSGFENRPVRREQPAGYHQPTVRKRKKGLSRKARRTIIVTCLVLVALAVVTCLIAIAGSFRGVGEVSSLQAEEVSAHQIVLSWEKAKNADTYHVLMAQGDSLGFEEIQSLNDTDTCTVSDLEQATAYSFKVTAYRGDKAGEPVKLANIVTLPDTPEVTNLFSAKAGTLHVDWSKNEKASGYLVEYKKNGGSYDADHTLTVSDPGECRADIDNLEKDADYSVRVSAYIEQDKRLVSVPSAEQSVKVVAQDTPVMPKAMDQQVDPAIDPNKPMIALTFDDGPALGSDSGDRILDTLEKYNVRATFFMLGSTAGDASENLKRKVELKMEIGNHTWNHTHLGDAVTPDDIRTGSNGIYDACGQFPTCFRSPGGATTATIMTECAAENMPLYYWTIDTQDWSSRNADAVYSSVMDNVKDGDIILMHEIYDSTADAVERMVPALIEKGYQLVTCHDLMVLKGGIEPVPGKQYASAYIEMDI